MKSFHLNGQEYAYLSPYIIAEIGVNHEGDLERAKRLIEGAAMGGAHAAKFQTYKAETLAARDTSPAYWDRKEEAADSQYALFKRWDNFGDDEYRALAAHCVECGVDFISTPFDLDAVDLLEPLMPVFKIASADITNIPLLRRVGATKKPVVMSVGAARHDETAVALQELARAGATDVTLLHCVLNYPTPPADAQLAQISLFPDGIPHILQGSYRPVILRVPEQPWDSGTAWQTVDHFAGHRPQPNGARTGLAITQEQAATLYVLPLQGQNFPTAAACQ